MCSPQTDYQLAKTLRVSRFRFSHWRRGKATPDNEVAWRLAQLLDMPITDVIAYFERDRATDPDKRAFWERQLPRLLPAIATAIAASSTALGGALIAGTRAALRELYIM